MTTEPLWIIQTNLLNPEHVDIKLKFLNCLGIRHQEIEVIPFVDDLPEIQPWDGPVIFLGSTKLTLNVWKNKEKFGWRPGVFYDKYRFSFEGCRKGFGENMLNYDSEIFALKDLKTSTKFQPEQEIFVRPPFDGKEFVGGVIQFQEICKRWEGVAGSKGDSLIQVSTHKWIEREWRTMIVDGEVITASQYMREHCLQLDDEVPNEVLEFASRMAALYSPAQVFTLDVGRVADTEELKIIECNMWNSSGYYRCDIYKMLDTVNKFLTKNY